MQADMENFRFVTELDYFLFYWLYRCVQTGKSLWTGIRSLMSSFPGANKCHIHAFGCHVCFSSSGGRRPCCPHSPHQLLLQMVPFDICCPSALPLLRLGFMCFRLFLHPFPPALTTEENKINPLAAYLMVLKALQIRHIYSQASLFSCSFKCNMEEKGVIHLGSWIYNPLPATVQWFQA